MERELIAFAGALPRISDGDFHRMSLSGGINASRIDNDQWHIEPFLVDGHPSARGPVTKQRLESFIKAHDLRVIAIQTGGWHGGCYHSNWAPIIPGQSNHLEGPSVLWGNIDFHRAKEANRRGALTFEPDGISNVVDHVSRLAESISLSLRNMDIHIEQIFEFYHEVLVDRLAA